MNLKFYLLSTISLFASSLIGFYVGLRVIVEVLLKLFGSPLGEEVLAFTMYTVVISLLSGVFGVVVALIAVERLGRKWGSQLSFGSHPVLKLTLLSFLTFLGLLVLLFFLIPTK